MRLIDEVMNRPDRMVALVTSRDPELPEPGPDQIHEIGTVAVVQRMVRVPDGTVRILAQGLRRIRVGPYTRTDPFLEAEVEEVPDRAERTTEVEALARNLQSVFTRVIDLVPHLPDELQVAVANLEDPTTLSYLIASSIRLSVEERQELLEEVDLEARLRRLTVLCNRELEVLELGAKIQSDVQLDMDKSQREFFLRQQLKAIREELGEGRDDAAEVEELRERLAEVDPPEEVRAAAERELARLERLPAESAEHGVVRTYLDWILSIPWNVTTEDDLDLTRARAILDEDHYDIEKVKDRIIEQLAVARLKRDAAGPILCFVGPPGRGQDLGRPVDRPRARAALRPHLGGRRARRERDPRPPAHLRRLAAGDDRARDPRRRGDEPGADGGRDRQDGRRRPRRPVGGDARGARPGPERRPSGTTTWTCRWTCRRCCSCARPTCSRRSPGPLLDRMEVIRLSGYTEEEKLHIARRYLLPRQIAAAGLPDGALEVTDEGLATIISEYTREAGVRQLERRLGAVARRVARRVAEGDDSGVVVDAAVAREILGPERIHNEVKRRTSEPGRGDRPGGDRGRRRDPLRGGDGDAGRRQADRDRPDRRRDARVGPGGRLVRARPGGRAGARAGRRLLLAPRHPPARARRRGAQGRPVGGGDDGDGPGVGPLGAPGERGRRDDRRDHAHRAGAADRRRQGEGARRAARGHRRGGAAQAQRGPARRPARRGWPTRCGSRSPTGWSRCSRWPCGPWGPPPRPGSAGPRRSGRCRWAP